MIAAREPFVDFTLEVPAGLVAVRVYCEQGHARSVELQNVPSFAERLDAPLEVEGLPTLSVDTAFGGDSFVIVDAEKLGFAIAPDEGHDIATLGARITRAANEQIGFSHPEKEWNHISFTQFSGPLTRECDVLFWQKRGGDRPGQDRSVTLWNRGICENGDTESNGADGTGRDLSGTLDHRRRIQLRLSGCQTVHRTGGNCTSAARPRLDHGNAPDHGRSDRPLSRRLSCVGYMAWSVKPGFRAT